MVLSTDSLVAQRCDKVFQQPYLPWYHSHLANNTLSEVNGAYLADINVVVLRLCQDGKHRAQHFGGAGVYEQDILHRAHIQRFCTTDSNNLEAAFQ